VTFSTPGRPWLSSGGVVAVAEALARSASPALTDLYWGVNDIDLEAADAIAALLRGTRTITHMQVRPSRTCR
jgi:hypothetical protein